MRFYVLSQQKLDTPGASCGFHARSPGVRERMFPQGLNPREPHPLAAEWTAVGAALDTCHEKPKALSVRRVGGDRLAAPP